MEEDKNKDIDKTSQAKESIDSTKNKTKKIKKIIEFIKKHPLLAKMLFWVCLAITIIVIFVSILYAIGLYSGKEINYTLDELKLSIQTVNIQQGSGTDSEENLNYIEAGAVIENNKYVLKYGDYDEDEKKRRVAEMKSLLKKNDIEIYSNQCLLFLYELKENGLSINQYNKEELEAMYMFFKAEIATSSLDLRPADEMYEQDDEGNYIYKYPADSIVPCYREDSIIPLFKKNKYSYSKEDYDENDYSDDTVCGTVRLQRKVYNGETTGTSDSKIVNLEYLQYDKFTKKLEDKNQDVLNYYTIDNENNLMVSGWSNLVTTYTFSGLESYTQEEQEEIKNNYQDSSEYEVYKYRDIPYQKFISKYSMNFNFLLSLLLTTRDYDFSKEVAKIAESSYMVITLHEENYNTTTTTTINHKDSEIVYSVLDANVSTSWNDFQMGTIAIGADDTVSTLKTKYNWNEDNGTYSCSSDDEDYWEEWKWTYVESGTKSKEYILMKTNEGITLNYKIKLDSVISESKNVNNIFLKRDRTFLKNGYPLQEIKKIQEIIDGEEELKNSHLDNLSNYTKKTIRDYQVVETIQRETNSYKIEVTEVNNWFEYYEKTYSKTEKKPIFDDIEPYEEEKPIEIGEREGKVDADYINVITDATKINFAKKEFAQSDIFNTKFEVLNVKEHYYKYGTQIVDSIKEGHRWAKGSEAKEKVIIKVQEGNKDSLLSIAIDADLNGEENKDENLEIIYGITGGTEEYTDGFLNIYDKYEGVQDTFNSIDEWTLEMMESSVTTINTADLLRYLLFLYDGTDLGVTEYNLSNLKPGDFNYVSRLFGNTLEDKVWYTLRSLGYSKASVAGVMGNLKYESAGFKTETIEGGTGNGIGLAQWSFGRRRALEAYAMSKGVDWTDGDTQIEFLIDEITGDNIYTNGYAYDSFQPRSYPDVDGGKIYDKSDWENANDVAGPDATEEEARAIAEAAIKQATTAFCVSWEQPRTPSDSLDTRIRYAIEYYEYYKDREYGGTYTTQECYGHVQAKFESMTGKVHLILRQTKTFLPSLCNRAACISVASAYAPEGTSVDELVEVFAVNYDSAYHGAIPSNKYWNLYGLELTNAYAGEKTMEYADALEEQLNAGGYALIWVNANGEPFVGKSGTKWSSDLYHWVAILGIKYEEGKCLIAVSTSGSGGNSWFSIDEFIMDKNNNGEYR